MIRVFATAFLILMLGMSTNIHAQDTQEARLEAAQRYIETPAVQDMMNEMFSPDAVKAMQASLVPAGSSTEAQREAAATIISEELKGVLPELERVMVNATAESFTLVEIEALVAFYGSPEGRSIMKKFQPYMQQSFRQLGPVLQVMQQTIVRRVREEVLQ